MTQIFICGLSTSQAELNDEDLQFYRDTKNKEICDVRQCLDFLSAFGACSKKEKMQADLQTVWKSMTVLSRILGYEADFSKINKLNLPEGLLIQDLLFSQNLFNKKTLRPRQLITHWENEVDQYLILLSGVVERQVTRTSILQSQHQNLTKTDYGGRYKRNARKRFTRTQGQIPVCLNSKRSQLRYGETCSGNFRSVTSSQVFSVQLSFWKRYVQKFKQIQQDYILNFIRKKLAINLNFQLQRKPKSAVNLMSSQSKQKDELKPSSLYSIESFDRKTTIELGNEAIFLLYMGQMLVVSPFYKLQMSKGCVLNSAIYDYLGVSSDQKCILVTASAKTDCIVIKLKIDLLNLFLMDQEEDFKTLFKFLAQLENHRRSNREEDSLLKKKVGLNSISKHNASNSSYKKLASPSNQNSILSTESMKNLLLNTKNTTFLPNCKYSVSASKKAESQSKLKATRQHIFEWKDIEERINKQQRVVELKEHEYNKKKLKTEILKPIENCLYGDQSIVDEYTKSIYNSSIFRNCMSRIQNHNAILAKAVQQNRKKKGDQVYTQQPTLAASKPISSCGKDIAIKLIKQRMKEVYIRTAQNEEILPYIHQKTEEQRSLCVESLTFGVRNQDFESSFAGQGLDFPSKRGVMKKVKRGQIRRIKAK